MPLRQVYVTRACEACGELNAYGTSCDRSTCSNYGGPLITIALRPTGRSYCDKIDETKRPGLLARIGRLISSFKNLNERRT
jgi:hypothetical protein